MITNHEYVMLAVQGIEAGHGDHIRWVFNRVMDARARALFRDRLSVEHPDLHAQDVSLSAKFEALVRKTLAGRKPRKSVQVHLADNEWGNETMRQVKDEVFASHPEIDMVGVRDHAGWYLTWNREGDIVATANDMAILSEKAMRYIRETGRVEIVESIRRQPQ